MYRSVTGLIVYFLQRNVFLILLEHSLSNFSDTNPTVDPFRIKKFTYLCFVVFLL